MDPVLKAVLIAFTIGCFAGCATVHAYQMAVERITVDVRWK